MSESRLLYNHVVDSLADKQVRDTIRTYVTELEQQNEQMLECMIYEFKANVKRFGLNKAKILKSCFIIESVTGKKIEEILAQEESDDNRTGIKRQMHTGRY